MIVVGESRPWVDGHFDGPPRVFRWTLLDGAVDLGLNPGFGLLVSRDGSTMISLNRAHRWTEATSWVPLPPDSIFSPSTVSSDGSVVAGQRVLPTALAAATWAEATGLNNLGSFPSGNSRWGKALHTSVDGKVVVGGAIDAASDRILAFRWTTDTGMSPVLDAAFARESFATTVSADGSVIVGFAGNSATASQGESVFRWTPTNGGEVLPNPPGVNRATFNLFRPFLPGASSTDGGVLLSEDGSTLIAGFTLAAGGGDSFRWTTSTGWDRLHFEATALSADGSTIVGVNGNEAAIWTAQGGLRRLEDVLRLDYGLGSSLAGWQALTDVWCLSSDGRVMSGTGRNAAGEPEMWIAILGAPVPEPSAMRLAFAAIALLISRLPRSRNRCLNSSLRFSHPRRKGQ
jgi:uncharacterized membrane protein